MFGTMHFYNGNCLHQCAAVSDVVPVARYFPFSHFILELFIICWLTMALTNELKIALRMAKQEAVDAHGDWGA